MVWVPSCCLVDTHDVSAISNCCLKQDIQTKAQTLHNNAINWYTSHRLIKKTMFHCWSLGLQRELHQNSGLFPLIYINTYQHKHSANTYQHTPKLWRFPTNTYPPNDPFPPHLFSQPKEVSSRVASHLSPETAPSKWATSSFSSCSLWSVPSSTKIMKNNNK